MLALHLGVTVTNLYDTYAVDAEGTPENASGILHQVSGEIILSQMG